jgi:hypothetical protein
MRRVDGELREGARRDAQGQRGEEPAGEGANHGGDYRRAGGRRHFAAGEYEASLVVAPPPGTLGATEQLGPIHMSIAHAGDTGSFHPHDDYSDMWWNPREPGWALAVHQLDEKLFIMWLTYDDPGKSAWLVVPGGAWSRDDQGLLTFGGKVYRTQGTPWQQPFDPAATHMTPVGTASFTPLDASHGIFRYTVDGIGGSKMIERFRF